MPDLISTGGSVITAVEALREAGCDVLGVVSIFTYELQQGIERLEASGIKNYSLSDYTTLLKVAAEKNYIAPAEIERLTRWKQNPEDTSWITG